MTTSTIGNDTPASASKPRDYWIRLRISPEDREDAWDLCRVALNYGGVEVRACCFAFADKEQWLAAMETLRFRFGPDYLEPFDSTETHHD
jgi:hypothetical protein